MLGFFLTMLIIGFFIMAMIMAMLSFAKTEETVVNENTVLHISFQHEIPDRTSNSPINFDIAGNFTPTPLGLNDIIKNIEKAARDDRVKGIFLELGNTPSGYATLEEIRTLLEKFKESDKFIVAYGVILSQKAYFLASVADQVYLHPEGFIDFRGLSAQVTFIKGLLDKLDIDPQVMKHGKYKSAVEPLLMDKMSEPNKEQTSTFINSIWNKLITNISESRGISITELNKIADDLSAYKAGNNVESGLTDALLYRDEVIEKITELTGIEDITSENLLSLRKYNNAFVKSNKPVSRNKIAVIYASGDIIEGKGDEHTIGSVTISKAISKARKRSSVKAIVLRVNSPGGDGLASDIIWREVALAKMEKPVIISMGNLAASGGYYISCAADKIYAHPSTITGSIGVFGFLPNFEKMFNNKLGITFDGVSTNENSDFMSITKPLTTYQKETMQGFIDDMYKTFVNHVSEGRELTFEQVDKIGEGRVWSGTNALEIGLIDELGGLTEAIEAAAELAELEDYRTVQYPELKDPILQILEDIMGESRMTQFMRKWVGNNLYYLQKVADPGNSPEIQAKLPYEINIH